MQVSVFYMLDGFLLERRSSTSSVKLTMDGWNSDWGMDPYMNYKQGDLGLMGYTKWA